MNNLFALAGIVFALAALVLFTAGVFALRRRRVFAVATHTAVGAALLSLAMLAGTIWISIQGYRALTREEVAAVVTLRPLGPQRFEAEFEFEDGHTASFELAGDQLYVDAAILKWKSVANIMGLHTAYRLDRVGGRYRNIAHERQRPRTVYPLAEDGLDMFELRREYSIFKPLLDAYYGSATFIAADKPQRLEIRVSTSGLLIRPRPQPGME